MGSLWAVVAAVLMAMLPPIKCDKFVITAMQQFQPNSYVAVAVTYFGDGTSKSCQISINATISGTIYEPSGGSKYYSSSATGAVSDGKSVIVKIPIGRWPSGNYVLNVIGQGVKLQFQRYINMYISVTKKSSLFIQTDKGIYQAGQKVNFRVISVNSKLLPYYINQTLDTYVTDANGNRIEQWTESIPDSGILEHSFPLSTQPVEGDWTIYASISDLSTAVTFTVTEYGNYFYEVWLASNRNGVKKYTYGQPVSGSYVINVTEVTCYSTYLSYYPYYTYNCTTRSAIAQGEFNGTATASIKTSDLNIGMPSNGATLTVVGTVTEEFTGLEGRDTKTFQMYTYERRLTATAQPNPYKPLLPLTVKISLTNPDGSPVAYPVGQGNATVSIDGGANSNIQAFTFKDDGTATIIIQPPEDSKYINIYVQYDGLNAYAYTSATTSLTNNFIAIDSTATSAQIEKNITIDVRSSFVMEKYITYLVTGNKKIVLVKTIRLSKPVTETSFTFKLTQEMSPSTSIAVYYVTCCGEIVGDALRINFDGALRTSLTLQMSTNQSQPGDNVTMTIKSAKDTCVAVLSVDQSVLMLSAGNDITKDKIYNELRGYNAEQYYDYGGSGLIKRPSYSQSLDVLFRQFGIQISTNCFYSKDNQCDQNYGRTYKPTIHYTSTMLRSTTTSVRRMATSSTDGPTEPEPTVASSSPRKFFPETWLWFTKYTEINSEIVIPLTVPDTITSWVITGFALNSKTGLGVTDAPTKLNVFKQFFLVVNLPFQVVRGETLLLQVLVFNYFQHVVNVTLTLEQMPGQEAQFTLLDESTKKVAVEANTVGQVTFLIKPTEVGLISFKIKSVSAVAGDTVINTLNVKAEGVPQYFRKAILVDLRNSSTFTGSVDIDVDSNAVPGSTFILFKGQANIMGNVIDNLHELIRMPYGCGEQNMINFVPDIVIMTYLKKINLLTSELETQLLSYLQIGYQTELKYKRDDGSFSAFGNSDTAGSVWLTAFVIKSFLQATSFITIDNNVIINAKYYMIRYQAADGSFNNSGRVVDNIKGGSAMTSPVFTAFVLIAFCETPANEGFKPFLDSIAAAVTYLENNLNNVNNAYEITIVTYALHLANSSKATEAFNKMKTFATKDGDNRYWQYQPPKLTGNEWWYYQAQPYDVEATSYALLVYLRRGSSIADQLPIVAWLVSKQSSLGGYSSTQDTVLALQALSQAAPNFAGPPSSSITCVITYGTSSATFTFTKQNELVHQQRQLLPNTIRSVEIKGTGNGVVIAQVAWNYNIVINKSGNSVFDLTVTPLSRKSDKVNGYVLNVCVAYKLNEPTGMCLVEAQSMSGFIWDVLPAVNHQSGLQRVESLAGNTLAVLYYNQIPTTPNKVCAQLTAAQTIVVNNLSSAQGTVYRYYSNDVQVLQRSGKGMQETIYDRRELTGQGRSKNESVYRVDETINAFGLTFPETM